MATSASNKIQPSVKCLATISLKNKQRPEHYIKLLIQTASHSSVDHTEHSASENIRCQLSFLLNYENAKADEIKASLQNAVNNKLAVYLSLFSILTCFYYSLNFLQSLSTVYGKLTDDFCCFPLNATLSNVSVVCNAPEYLTQHHPPHTCATQAVTTDMYFKYSYLWCSAWLMQLNIQGVWHGEVW